MAELLKSWIILFWTASQDAIFSFTQHHWLEFHIGIFKKTIEKFSELVDEWKDWKISLSSVWIFGAIIRKSIFVKMTSKKMLVGAWKKWCVVGPQEKRKRKPNSKKRLQELMGIRKDERGGNWHVREYIQGRGGMRAFIGPPCDAWIDKKQKQTENREIRSGENKNKRNIKRRVHTFRCQQGQGPLAKRWRMWERKERLWRNKQAKSFEFVVPYDVSHEESRLHGLW